MDGLRDVDLQSQTPAIVEMEAPEAVVLRAEAQRMLSPDALHWLKKVDELKHFLIFAPSEWQQNEDMRRFPLFSGDFVSCVLWDSIFYITGTDIVRCVSFRVHAFGRRVENFKKFEEGVFSDLRYLKPGTHASLEKPRSQFLDFLFKNRCIRTKKKQKVFFWYSVPHDRLFLDALERDIRREKMGQVPTSVAVAEPALSFQHEPSKSLYERLVDTSTARHSSNAWQLDFAHQKLMAPREDATEPMPHQSMIADTHQQPAALRETVAGALPHQDMMAAIRAGSISSYDGLETDPLNFTAVSREFPVAGFQCHQNDVHFHGQPHHTQTMLTGLDYSPHPTIPSSHQFHYGVSPPQHTAGVYTQLADILDGAHPNQFTGLPTMTHHPPWNVTAPQLPSACGQTNLYWVQQVSPTYKRRRRRRYGSAGSVGVSASAPSDHEAHHGPIALKKSASEASSTVSQPETPEKPEMTAHKDPHVDFATPKKPASISDCSPEHNNTSGSTIQNNIILSPATVVQRGQHHALTSDNVVDTCYSCQIPDCGRMFKWVEHLKRHIRIHTQDRPYICFYCDKAFTSSDNRMQHMCRRGRESSGKHPNKLPTEGRRAFPVQIARIA